MYRGSFGRWVTSNCAGFNTGGPATAAERCAPGAGRGCCESAGRLCRDWSLGIASYRGIGVLSLFLVFTGLYQRAQSVLLRSCSSRAACRTGIWVDTSEGAPSERRDRRVQVPSIHRIPGSGAENDDSESERSLLNSPGVQGLWTFVY